MSIIDKVKKGDNAPKLMMDLGKVEEKYKSLQGALPGFNIYYAVKCNPEEPILRRLKSCGSNFEVASLGELKRLTKIGVKAGDVLYTNPVKPVEHIRKAYKAGIGALAFDSPEELSKIAQNAPGSKVFLRLSVSNYGSLINLASKFGADKDHAVSMMTLAEDLGLVPYGIAFHVGSQSENMQLWDQAFDDTIETLEALKKHGIILKTLNIGGGFPIKYIENVPSISSISRIIKRKIDKLPYDMELLCEPGRFLVGEAGILEANVIGRTTRKNKPWLFIDVGRFQFFNEMFESDDLKYPVSANKGMQEITGPKYSYTLTGPSCDSYDTLMHEVSLPTDLKVGDKIYIGSAGAYTHVYGAPFNDFPVPKIEYFK